jgi:hypothetical protein
MAPWHRPEKIVRVADMQGRIVNKLIERVPGEKAHAQLVPARCFTQLIDAYVAACTRGVTDDDRRDTREILGQVLGDDARFYIGRTTGGKIDDHVDRLAGELLGLGTTGTCHQDDGDDEWCEE